MQFRTPLFETLESRRFLSVAPLPHPAAAAGGSTGEQAAVEVDADNVQAGPGNTTDGTDAADSTDAADTGTTAAAAKVGGGTTLSVFGSRRTHTNSSILGAFSGTLKVGKGTVAFVLQTASQTAGGAVSGTITTGTGSAAVTSAFTGTVRGRRVTFTFTQGGSVVSGSGKVSRDGRTLSGAVSVPATGRHGHKTHGKFVATHA